MSVRILRLLLFLLVFSLPLGQLGRVPFLDPTVGVYISDLMLGIFCVLGFYYLLVSGLTDLRVNLSIVFGLAFVLWALATLAFGASVLNSTELIISFSYWVRLALFVVFFAEIYALRKVSPQVLEGLPLWLVLSGIILAMAGFVQLFVFPDFGMLDLTLGWDPHYFRLNSTFFDPNFTGAYLVLCLVLLSQITRNKKQETNLLFAVCFLLLLTAIFLTFSRSAWLMLAIVVFIYGLFKSRLLLIMALVLAFGAYFAVPRVQTRLVGITDPADSAQFRIASWQEGLQLSQKNLLTGVGFNALRYAKDASEFYDYKASQTAHSGAGFDSSLLVVLATTGVLGLLLFSMFCLSSLIGLIGGISSIRVMGKRRLLLGAVFLALLVESNFVNSLFYAPIMVVEAAILGLFVD